jgi:ELMO/CED-12 family
MSSDSSSEDDKERVKQAAEWAMLEAAQSLSDGSSSSGEAAGGGGGRDSSTSAPDAEGEAASEPTKGRRRKKSGSKKKKKTRKPGSRKQSAGPRRRERLSCKAAHVFYAEEAELDADVIEAARIMFENSRPGFFQRLWRALTGGSLEAGLRPELDRALALSKVPFGMSEETSAMNYNILTEVWHGLGLDGTPNRTGGHWEQVGFQGDDPATDLRSSGSLALLLLLHFVQAYPKEALHGFKLSQDDKQNFPFAVVSINITKTVLGLLRNGKLHSLANAAGSVWQVVYDLHAAALVDLFTHWEEHECTVADFGNVVKDLAQQLEKNAAKSLASLRRKRKPKLWVVGTPSAKTYCS